MPNSFLFLQGYNPSIREIDLHGTVSKEDALCALERDLFQCYSTGEKYVRVISGIGTGVLKAAVLSALSKNPLVVEFQEEDSGGSFIVRL